MKVFFEILNCFFDTLIILGETVIIISAMKMESEYKAPKDGTIKKINVKNDDTIEGNQILIELDLNKE